MSSTADESESALPWLAREITVETTIRLLVAVVSLVGAFFAVFSLRFVRLQRAAYVLSRAKVKLTRGAPDYLLARPTVTAALQKTLENRHYNTILVYGQRGSGKTTAIEQTLSTRSGVLQWTLSADEGAAATKELDERWKEIFHPWIKPFDRDFELDVCASILKSRGKALIIVLSVESSAKPAALKNVLHYCKTMSYNTHLVRFVVDISSSRAAVALQTDLTKLRISPVVVGCITLPEANALVSHTLPDCWTDPKKQAVTREITDKFDLLLLTLIEVCEKMEEGMATEDAIECVKKIYDDEMMKASSRLKTFDALLKEKIKDLDGKPPIPNLLKENPDKLDPDGIDQLTDLISPPVFMAIVSEAGSPYIFDVDPFTEVPSLNGKIMTSAFVQRYKKKTC
mmetsp:Transcript_12808/g.31092  ORF Transcript_12808/g.31092 Transcript_12808/m.31092 type:complete len:399 (-) Transcript_12808:179-1375(-)|eukprot:CAMPEP_0113465296 /NCGR_PEP_ID=MMETSP0014_2-20120614/13662_1 /TAXON_ID=2857 /ORGANISM="Nitzschia sp." /LENGTH=398 /DNA_ID=CAMNT_0000357441 /DNA_START=590 /DNA_END=1786 /DNA_ORIENTATION=+ /assembly_acc=CAM_ASM_000159